MQFPGRHIQAECFAAEWCSMKNFSFPDGSTAGYRPIDIIYQTLNDKGYNVIWVFGNSAPDGAIRIRVKE